MTYFTFKQVRRTRAEHAYVGSTLLGRVAVRTDWRSRLTLSAGPRTYYATRLGGELLAESFPSRHDAAEALYEIACRGRSATDEVVTGQA